MPKDKNDSQNEENEDNEEESEEEEDDSEEDDSTPSDPRLKKSIDRMIKESGIDKSKLKGLSLEEQFDRLEFLLDNLPEEKEDNKKRRKNKPVAGLPTGDGGIGRKVRVGNKTFYHFHPSEWLKFRKDETV